MKFASKLIHGRGQCKFAHTAQQLKKTDTKIKKKIYFLLIQYHFHDEFGLIYNNNS